jgi:IS4 transposase
VKYVISEPGRKQGPFVVVTNMLERSGDEGVSAEDMAELYGFRWNVELDIRSMKTHLNIDFMRCKLMVEPRNQLRHRLSKGDNSFE